MIKTKFKELVKQKYISLRIKNGLSDEDLDVLIRVIEQNTVLEKLNVENLALSDKFVRIVEAITNTKNTTLKSLWLSGSNFFGDEGAKCLANMLRDNKTIKELNITDNNIGTEGVKYLANALKKNDTLEVLYLGYNNIGDEGAKCLADMLTVNKTLQKVWLDNEGAKCLTEMLAVNKTVQKIGLGYIGDEGMKKIKAALNDPKRKMPKSSSGVVELNEEWHSDNDMHHRIWMLQYIPMLLKLMDNDASPELKKLCSMVKQVEVTLYRSASSLQAYLDKTTLETRLQQLAMEFAKKTLAANSSESRVASVLKEAKTNKQQKGEERIAQSKASNDKKIAAKDKEKDAAPKLAASMNNPKLFAMLKQSIAKKERELKDKDAEIAKISRDNAKKDKQITSFKMAIRGLSSILDPVDLTTMDDDEPPYKRARTEEDIAKSALAVQHESIKEAVKVKEESINDYVSFLQSKIDELASVAEAGGADKEKVAEIQGRLRLNFDEFVSATAMTNMS